MRKNLIISALLVFLFIVPASVSLAASESAQLTIQCPEKLPQTGDTFSVSINLTENPGFCAVQFSIPFDSTALECTKVESGTLLSGMLAASNPNSEEGMAMVAAVTSDSVQGDGTLAVLHFKAKSNVPTLDFRLVDIILNDEAGMPVSYTVVPTSGSHSTPNKPQDDTQHTDSSSSHPSKGPSTSGTSSGDTDSPKNDSQSTKPISFVDIAGHWGENAIIRSAELGLFQGYPDNTFRPDDAVSRVQFVAVMWRSAGSPEPNGETPFTDIGNQLPAFQTAIRWAYETGRIKGTSDTTFSPEKALTRQEALTILHRCAGSETGLETMLTSTYDNAFSDSEQIAPWAKTAMYWGVYHQIISGTTSKTLSPLMNTTRAQMANIMVDYLDRFADVQGRGGENK